MTSLSPLRPPRNALRWLCAGLAAIILVLAGVGPDNADELASPTVVALATVDIEPSDFDIDLPLIRVGPSSIVTPWLHEGHEGAPVERPATRTPSPPDRPPRPV